MFNRYCFFFSFQIYKCHSVFEITIDVDYFLQWARAISQQVREKGILFNLKELQSDQQKRTVSVLVVNKKTKKISKTIKDLISKYFTSLDVKVLAVIAGTSYAFWDVLVPTIDDAVARTQKVLESKEYTRCIR